MDVTRQDQVHPVFLGGDQRAHILRLPTEVIDHVARYLPDGAKSLDLLHLRTTCRDMRAKTELMVARQYFSNGHFFTADEESLRALQDISKHPVFAKSMREIYLCVGVADPHMCPHSMDQEGKARVDERRPTLRRIRVAQVDFRHRGRDLNYLRNILSNFKDVDNFPALLTGLVGGNRTAPFTLNAFGYSKFRKQLGLEPRRNFYPYFNDGLHGRHDYCPFEVIIKAVAQAEYHVNKLVVGHEGLGILPGIFKHFRGSTALFSLKFLRLTLDGPITDSFLPEAISQSTYEVGIADLIDALRSADNLEIMELSSAGPYCHCVPEALFCALASAATVQDSQGRLALRKIQALELSGMPFEFADLLSLVRSVRSTLTRLAIPGYYDDWHVNPGRSIRNAHGGEDLTLEGPMFATYYSDSDSDTD